MGLPDPRLVRAWTLCPLILLAISGCLDGTISQPSVHELTYSVRDERLASSGNATLTWRFVDSSVTFIDYAAGPRKVGEIIWRLEAPTGGSSALATGTFLYDVTTREDIAILDNCSPPIAECPSLSVEWPGPGRYFSLFGSFAISALKLHDDQTATLYEGPNQVKYHIYPSEVGLTRLVPQKSEGTPREASLCNIRDDDVTIDLARLIVVQCVKSTKENILTYTLTGEIGPHVVDILQRNSDNPAKDTGFADLEARNGPLPPGAELTLRGLPFPLKEAHEGANRQSKGLAEFLNKHPEAAFESAGYAGNTTTSSASGLIASREDLFRLEYVAGGRQGYRVEIARIMKYLGGQLASTDYVLQVDESWEPPEAHRWDLMKAMPAKLASLTSASTKIQVAGSAWTPTSVTIINAAGELAEVADYGYYFGVGPNECSSMEACREANTIVVSGTTGYLQAGSFFGLARAPLFQPEG